MLALSIYIKKCVPLGRCLSSAQEVARWGLRTKCKRHKSKQLHVASVCVCVRVLHVPECYMSGQSSKVQGPTVAPDGTFPLLDEGGVNKCRHEIYSQSIWSSALDNVKGRGVWPVGSLWLFQPRSHKSWIINSYMWCRVCEVMSRLICCRCGITMKLDSEAFGKSTTTQDLKNKWAIEWRTMMKMLHPMAVQRTTIIHKQTGAWNFMNPLHYVLFRSVPVTLHLLFYSLSIFPLCLPTPIWRQAYHGWQYDQVSGEWMWPVLSPADIGTVSSSVTSVAKNK